MSTVEPEPQSCWECKRGKLLCLPNGVEYIDCPPAHWVGHACAAKLLKTIDKPFHIKFEWDSASQTLLMRFAGQLTAESLEESYRMIRKYTAATDAKAGIWDYSCISHVSVSGESVCSLAHQAQAMPDATKRVGIIVAPTEVGYGLARMFQIVGETSPARLIVERAMDTALTVLGLQSPHFEPLA
ncbi:MAG: hypothetical protein ACLP0H_13430 [Terriglobales bacterium]